MLFLIKYYFDENIFPMDEYAKINNVNSFSIIYVDSMEIFDRVFLSAYTNLQNAIRILLVGLPRGGVNPLPGGGVNTPVPLGPAGRLGKDFLLFFDENILDIFLDLLRPPPGGTSLVGSRPDSPGF